MLAACVLEQNKVDFGVLVSSPLQKVGVTVFLGASLSLVLWFMLSGLLTNPIGLPKTGYMPLTCQGRHCKVCKKVYLCRIS